MFHSTDKARIRRNRVFAVALTAAAGAVFLFSALPANRSTSTYEARAAVAEARNDELEIQRQRYLNADVSIEDLRSPVPALSETSGSVRSDVKLALFSTLTGLGLNPPEGVSVTETSRPGSQLIGFGTSIQFPGGFSDVDKVLEGLRSMGYLVAVNSLDVIAPDNLDDIRGGNQEHEVTLGLVFWFMNA